MDSLLQLTPRQRNELFAAAAQNSGINAIVLEKDFWVCWSLKELFGLPVIGENLIFKGGTSLSKIFKVINRFSEDIDVSINRSFLGFGGDNDPEVGGTNKEKQRRIEALKTACQQKIEQELMPSLQAVIRSKLHNDEWLIQVDGNDPDKHCSLTIHPHFLPRNSVTFGVP
jgi:hypothetical protein